MRATDTRLVLDTRAGVRHIAPSLIEMARSYGASRAAMFGKVVVKAALPEILAGVRLGLVRGVKGVVIGQLLVSIVGYGAPAKGNTLLNYCGVRGDFLVQLAGVAATVAYSGAMSFVVLVAVDGLVGLRVSGATETEGLDIVEHGEAVA